VISNILSQFYRLQNSSSFGLYAIPFKTSAVVFLTIFLRPERSIIPSTDPFAGFTTAIASFAHLHKFAFNIF
jgi:hypothetical protein